jgi:outer membrane protein|tara:strand:- start:131 stop:670 length:540 start_codon:yes stop_codon:yes gene_type:complete
MKNLFKLNLLAVLVLSIPVFAVDGMAVIDMRTAVLSTQAATNAFKALEEDADYSSNLEEAQTLQSERQAIAEKLQKDLETLSQEEIAKMQKDIQDKGQDLEFLAGKIQQAQEETAQKVFADSGPSMQKIIGELIQAKQIKVLLQKSEAILFSDPAIDLTDDVTSMLDVAASSEASTQSE